MNKLCACFSRNRKGFTLVELMIVVVIMAILVAVAVPLYMSLTDTAEKRTCRANMRILVNILSNYSLEGKVEPGSVQAIPDMQITNVNGTPTFAVYNGSDSAEVQKMGEWLLKQYQVKSESCCCVGGGVITVDIDGDRISVGCSKHGDFK